MENQHNDHDILTTLVANVQNLKESQENFHKEMKDSLNDLKNNYSIKLADHETRLNKLESNRNTTAVLLSIWIGILGILTSIMIWHVVK